jgi:hypothetical protein
MLQLVMPRTRNSWKVPHQRLDRSPNLGYQWPAQAFIHRSHPRARCSLPRGKIQRQVREDKHAAAGYTSAHWLYAGRKEELAPNGHFKHHSRAPTATLLRCPIRGAGGGGGGGLRAGVGCVVARLFGDWKSPQNATTLH